MQPRDARLAASPGLDRAALERLAMADVAVIGTGMLGGVAIVHLGLLGVNLVLVDPGTVEPPNLANQTLPAQSVGEPKVAVRARQIAELNPDCTVHAVAKRIEDLGLGALASVDLLLTGLDGRAARSRVNEIAFALQLPWLDMAVDGSGRWLRGTVTYYDPRVADAGCYLCARSARDVASIAREGRGPGCPSWRAPDVAVTPPTLQTSALGGLVGAYAAMWGVRVLLGNAGVAPGSELVIECDGVPRLRSVTRTRNARCLFPHRPLESLLSSASRTVGELLVTAAADLGAEPEMLDVHARTLVHGLACPGCAGERDLVRVSEACSDDDVRCDRCGTEMVPRALSSRLAGDAARSRAGLSWRDLGLPAAEVVTASGGGRSLDYIVNGRPIT